MNPYEDVSASEIRALINEWVVGRNAERDRAILVRRLVDGVCFEPLAEEFGLSTRHVKNIVYRRQAQIFRHYK